MRRRRAAWAPRMARVSWFIGQAEKRFERRLYGPLLEKTKPRQQASLRSLRKLGCFGRGFCRETAPNYFRFGGVNQNRSPQVAASFQVSCRFCCQLATIAARIIPLLHPNIPHTQPVGP